MTQITIKIELSGLDKAMTEVEAVKAYILELAKTYPTTFKNQVETVATEAVTKPKTVRKPKKVSEPVKEVKEVVEAPEPKKVTPKPTVEEVEKVVEEVATAQMALGDLTALAKSAVAKGGRDVVKELVLTYSTTAKISDVPTDKYEVLAEALRAV